MRKVPGSRQGHYRRWNAAVSLALAAMAKPMLHLLDSIGYVRELHAGTVIVSGSHGGTSAAGYILNLQQLPLAAFFNDAGRGKNDAGVAGLVLLNQRGVIAATYSHLSARIGDAADGLASGILTALNDAAASAGLQPGWSVQRALAHLNCDFSITR